MASEAGPLPGAYRCLLPSGIVLSCALQSSKGCPAPLRLLLTTATGPQVRNMVLTRWRQDVTHYLTLAQVRAAAGAPLCHVLDVRIPECSTGSADTLVGGRQLCSRTK